MLNAKPRETKTEVYIYYGATGTGKSHACQALMDAEDTYWKQVSKWWDNYAGQELVIVDEFEGWLEYPIFLQIMDQYPLQVEVKGGNVEFCSKKIAFTSNMWPAQWYESSRANIEAFKRRVDHWIYCDSIHEHHDYLKDWDAFVEHHLQQQQVGRVLYDFGN